MREKKKTLGTKKVDFEASVMACWSQKVVVHLRGLPLGNCECNIMVRSGRTCT